MLDEALRIILPALRGEKVDLDGEFYQVRDFALRPLPVQPKVPLHMGGGGDRILALAARYADMVTLTPIARGGGMNPEEVKRLTPERFAERVAYLRRHAEQAGRDPASVEIGGFLLTRVTQSPAETSTVARALGGAFGVDEKGVRESPLVLIGTPAEIAAELQRRRDAFGLRWALLTGRPSKETIELFGKEIIPRV
jgi:alkanesulfonate monooxygenase SsuD/methylene tetrahydromethanopterin reductase-like flavin-dependent oxidoreductase (luciferase family)